VIRARASLVGPLLLPTFACVDASAHHLATTDSCRAVLAADPAAVTGLHALTRGTEDGTESRQVWCDMTTAGGGWTLVGRSVPGRVDERFGWTLDAGFVSEDSLPYSLDATEIPFTELLVGTRGVAKAWGGDAFILAVPADLIAAYPASAFEVQTYATAIGSCAPQGVPAMLSWVGHTADDQHFFLRDHEEKVNFGLFAGGFNMAYDDCEHGGNLNQEQGMIFVR
jgi:hypothetical protein